jgi:hypothetical protein
MTAAALNGIEDMPDAGAGLDDGMRLFMRLLREAALR